MRQVSVELLEKRLEHLLNVGDKAGEVADTLFKEGEERDMPRANYKLGFYAGVGHAVDLIRVLLPVQGTIDLHDAGDFKEDI